MKNLILNGVANTLRQAAQMMKERAGMPFLGRKAKGTWGAPMPGGLGNSQAVLTSGPENVRRVGSGSYDACLTILLIGLNLVASVAQAQVDATKWGGSLLALHDEVGVDPNFYSPTSDEREVAFDGILRTQLDSLEEVRRLDESAKRDVERYELRSMLQFLSGPLTQRALAAPQRGARTRIDWSGAKVSESGKVEVPFHYDGVWLIKREGASGTIEIPLPFSETSVQTRGWKRCTDSDPEHQTLGFYWYFWDPERFGCQHQLGKEFQNISVRLGQATTQQTKTYPEYDRMIRREGRTKTLGITVGFGYVEDESGADPIRSKDAGMREYRAALRSIRAKWGRDLEESPIREEEYQGAVRKDQVIGVRFAGTLRGVKVELKVVTSTDIDQMELFAKSFAHDHDGAFAWFGHSRVGSGFDAEAFEQMVREKPDYYQVSTQYQLVYWGGCNSYSYYTAPFFDIKARAASGTDPKGTRNLDIIANGMPSFFSLNAGNAMIALDAWLDWENPRSFQDTVTEISKAGEAAGTSVLPVVLGDEDNALPVGLGR